MKKGLIYWVAGILCAGALASFWLEWSNSLSRNREFSAATTEKDLAAFAARHGQTNNSRQAQAILVPLDLSHPLRLAIGGLGLADNAQNQQVGDLVTADLTGAPGLSLVERQSLTSVLRELNLSLSGFVRAKDAVRAGKLLKADWFLFGTVAKINGTNPIVLLRLVEARTGILREAQVVPFESVPTQLAANITAFVRQSRQDATHPQLQKFLAIGGFEDVSLNNHQENFPNDLRAYLTAAYRKSGVTLLEREATDLLLQEVCLDLSGLAEDGGTNEPQAMPSAYWLVDGSYQSWNAPHSVIEVSMGISRMFGPWSPAQSVFHGKPDVALFQQIKTAIDARLNSAKPLIFPTRFTEARAQMDIGKRLAHLSDGVPEPFAGMAEEAGLTRADSIQDLDEQELGRLRHNTEQAIHAFETVLLLDRANREAKMCLAACFRKEGIGRMAEARDIYQGIINAPIRDKWTGLAGQALVASFYWSGADEKARWFAAAAQQYTNSPADEFYRQNAESAARDAAIENGHDDATELAEKRLLDEIRSSKKMEEGKGGTFYGGYGLYNFQSAFQDRATAAQKMAAFLPKMEAEFPELSPILSAEVLAFQVDTNSQAVGEFRKALDRCRKDPTEFSGLHDFWLHARYSAFYWLYKHGYYSDAVKIMEGFQAAVKENKKDPFNFEDQIALAFAYKGARRWNEALAIFQSFTNRPMLMTATEPWGCTLVQTCQEANECRENLGLPTIHDPREFSAGKTLLQMEPFSNFTDDTTFKADTDGSWLGSGNWLYHLDWNLKTNFAISLPKEMSTPIYALCISATNIWIATGGDGLIEFDKRNHLCRRFTVADGLMMNAISSLSLTRDKLWIGYGYKYQSDREGLRLPPGGGIGYLDLLSNQFVAFQPSLANGTEAQEHLAGNVVMESPDKPTRRVVPAIVARSNGDVWFLDEESSLRRFQGRLNLWDATRARGNGLAINDSWLVVGHISYLSGRRDPSPGPPGVDLLDLQSGRWTALDYMPGLPAGAASAVALNGNDLWVGGAGYIALFDARHKKLRRFCYIPAQNVDKIEIGGGYVWAQYNGWLHRVSSATP